MTLDRYLRLIAGALIVLSLMPAHCSDPPWLYFPAFTNRSP